MIEAFGALGFSPYEAKAYAGLLEGEAQTGYALSKVTGIPQPKVYETLRRLEQRGVVHKLAGRPVQYVGVSPEQLLSALDDRHAHVMRDLRDNLELLTRAPSSTWQGVETFETRTASLAAASTLIGSATRRVYLSAHRLELEALTPSLVQAAERGIDLVMLHFGPLPEDLPSRHAYGHHSTDGTLYRHHQARHLALVIDSESGLWGVAPDGQQWRSAKFVDSWLTALVKGFIRHDLYFQRVYSDFAPELHERYGPSLDQLTDFFDPPRVEREEAVPDVDDGTARVRDVS